MHQPCGNYGDGHCVQAGRKEVDQEDAAPSEREVERSGSDSIPDMSDVCVFKTSGRSEIWEKLEASGFGLRGA